VKLYPPKAPFSEDHILAHRGCCTPNFLYVLENDKVLLAHPHGNWGPLYNFFSSGSKIGLKFIKCAHITLAVVGVAPCNFVT